MVASGQAWPDWIVLSSSFGGLFVFGRTVFSLAISRVSHWKLAEARIEWLKVLERKRDRGRCDIAVEYSFYSENKKYQGSRISVLDDFPGVYNGYTKVLSMRLTAAYEAGRGIDVYICPIDASASVLVDVDLGRYIFEAALLFVIAAVLFFVEIYFRHASFPAIGVGFLFGCLVYAIWRRWRRHP